METFRFEWDLKQFEILNSSGKSAEERGRGPRGDRWNGKGGLGVIMGGISQLSDSTAYIQRGNGCVMQ